jgi:hypothetical protein
MALLGVSSILLAGCDAPKEQPSAPVGDVAKAAVVPQGVATDEKLASAKTIETSFGQIRIEEVGLNDGAHVEGGRLAVTYLASGKSYPDTVQGGSIGAFGEWSVDDRFSAYPVIVSSAGGTGQGYTCSTTQLTELRPEGPTKLVSFKDHFDNDGVPGAKPEAIDGKVVAVERGRGFTVQFTGTRQFTAVYTRKGNSYDLQGGDAHQIDGC